MKTIKNVVPDTAKPGDYAILADGTEALLVDDAGRWGPGEVDGRMPDGRIMIWKKADGYEVDGSALKIVRIITKEQRLAEQNAAPAEESWAVVIWCKSRARARIIAEENDILVVDEDADEKAVVRKLPKKVGK